MSDEPTRSRDAQSPASSKKSLNAGGGAGSPVGSIFLVRQTNLETQDERERFIDSAQLVRIEASRRASQALGIYDSRLLDKDARVSAIESNRGSKARRLRTRRGRRNEDGARRQELVGLNDHRVARASLLPAARPSRGRQAKYLTAHHLSRCTAAPVRPSVRASLASPLDRPHQPRAV